MTPAVVKSSTEVLVHPTHNTTPTNNNDIDIDDTAATTTTGPPPTMGQPGFAPGTRCTANYRGLDTYYSGSLIIPLNRY